MCRRSTAALVLLAVCSSAMGVASTASAQANLVELTSHAGYSSAMYNAGTALSESISPSLADWDAKGRHGRSDTGPLPTTPFFAQDLAQGWSEFGQVGAGGALHSFAQAGGYYLNSGGTTFADTRAVIHNRVRVTNNGPHANFFAAAYATHGYLLSGGITNCVTAFSQETAIITAHTWLGDARWGWTGAARVFAGDVEPTISVHGDWVGATSPVTRAVTNFVDPFKGIELSLLGSTDLMRLNPGESMDIDYDFDGYYSATSSVADSGFLSLGQADFSGSGSISYAGFDGVTGLPTNDITFELVGIPAPGVGALCFALLGGGIIRHRRMRAG
ncbi:MAG: hypothetical protein U0638_07215 [Phycisphaerales bacterium]